MVFVVPTAQVKAGVHPVTFNVIVPVGPAPQTTVAESLVAVGGVKNVPPVTDHVYPVQLALV